MTNNRSPSKSERERRFDSLLLVIHGIHVADELHDLVGITPLVVVPGNDLHEVVVQVHAGLGVEDGGAGIASC